MVHPEHDFENLIPKYKHKYELFDKIVLSIILITLGACTALMFLGLFNPQYFTCLWKNSYSIFAWLSALPLAESAVCECIMGVTLPDVKESIMQLKYKYITKNFFDVFWGDGWDNCIRVKRNQQKNFVILRAYKKPPRDIIKQIEGDFNETL